MRNKLDCLKDVIKDNNSVADHEEGFGNAEGIFKRPGRLGLEVLDTVVGDVSDSSACQQQHEHDSEKCAVNKR